MRRSARNAPAALCALALCLPAATIGAPPQTAAASAPSAYIERLEAALLLQTLNADLLSHDSATATLQRWCDVHQLASPARITAERASDLQKPLTPVQREQLHLGPADEVRYRNVRLRCGDLVLSEADNWYVPARLTPE